MSNNTDELVDRIEREIMINASADRVWALVSRPGWWINEGDVDPLPVVRHEEDYDVIIHPTYGEFRLLTATFEPPRHISFRWIEGDQVDAGTEVDFWVDDRAEGGVTLRVVESGFASLPKDRELIISQVAENTSGWETELAAAQRYVLALGEPA